MARQSEVGVPPETSGEEVEGEVEHAQGGAEGVAIEPRGDPCLNSYSNEHAGL